MVVNSIKSSKVFNRKGNYSSMLQLGDYVFVSMILPQDCEGNISKDVVKQCQCVMENLKLQLSELGLSFKHVMKVNLYLKNIDDLKYIEETYKSYFEVMPARSVIGVNALENDSLIGIDALVIDTRALEVLCANETCDEDECSCTKKGC